jgi:CRP-like cAMP-binding protein
VRERVGLVHIADRDVPAAFAPAKPPLWGTEVLVPPSARSRHRILVETLRLVGYLFDLPTDTLDELLNGGEVRWCRAGEVVIRKGFIPQGQPIDFYVIADGEMSVQDGRRVLTRLTKADSFGEWGISHQRGFRAADVVAGRPSQLLQFSEAQYHWLVGKHPVIQERISKIRSLLPRLQQAQGRARLKVESGLSRQRSVIQDMSTSQLASFAIFSKVMPFRQGQIIVAQGEKADGFYILLSGHLVVRVEGRTIGEISEGDVFGEMGLLEGGRREANVSVASADAEVLFMSTKSFQGLLHSVPAFAWGIWETAAARRESNAGPRLRRSSDR